MKNTQISAFKRILCLLEFGERKWSEIRFIFRKIRNQSQPFKNEGSFIGLVRGRFLKKLKKSPRSGTENTG